MTESLSVAIPSPESQYPDALNAALRLLSYRPRQRGRSAPPLGPQMAAAGH